jgi:fermentation-respiration switch protein FrsA (DUF1100 family)
MPEKGFPRWTKPALRVLLLLYAGVILVAATFADRLIFVPPPPSYDAGLEGLVRLSSDRGDTVAAVYLPASESTLTVLFAHGNAEDLGDLMPHLEFYRALGVSVMAFDYPGYGLSTGHPSEKGAYAAARAAYDHLSGPLGVDPARIVAHGRSLGGGVLVDLAAGRPLAGLIIESSFVSAYRVMTRFPLLPADKFRSLRKMAKVKAPVLVVHGTADEVIAPWHGRRLAEAVPESRRTTLWVDGAGHNDLALVAGDSYWNALRSFLGSIADTLRGV